MSLTSQTYLLFAAAFLKMNKGSYFGFSGSFLLGEYLYSNPRSLWVYLIASMKPDHDDSFLIGFLFTALPFYNAQ